MIRVASVPAGHAYVRHTADETGSDGVVRLPDEPVPGAPDGQWWPAPMLEPSRVRTIADRFDVFHLHFGFEHRTPEQLRSLVDALRDAGRPLVFTVHDLTNPHLPDPAAHLAALDVLVPAADALVTLTPGAAAEVARRWGRTPEVVPHPHVVPLSRRSARPLRPGFRIGVHAKSVRTNSDPVGTTRLLTAAIAGLPGARIRFDAHDDDAGRAAAAAVADLPGVDVHVHPAFDDDALWAYLESLDLAVLPYRWGTHSGWLEACHDLGTPVLAPRFGHYAEQGPCFTHDGSPSSVAAAVRDAYEVRPRWRAEGRREQRAAIAAAHARIYGEVLAAREVSV